MLFSCQVVSNSLQLHGLQHTRLACSTLSFRVCSSSCPLRWWYYPTVSSFATLFSLCSQSSKHQGLFQWVGSSHQVAKGLELQHQSFQWIFKDDFLQYCLVWSLFWPKDSQESSPATQLKAPILWCSAFFMVQISHSYMTTGKAIALTIQTFVSKVMSLLFSMLYVFNVTADTN